MQKTCVFWHWERQYEEYLLEHGHLGGAEQEVDDDEARKKKTGRTVLAQPGESSKNKKVQEAGMQADEIMPVMLALLQLGFQVVMLLKCFIVLLFMMLVVALIAFFRV